jgi:uncharacterized protein (TIGR02466 family)
MATIRSLFHTPLYQGELGDEALLARLVAMSRMMSVEDRAGRAWSKAKGYRGYTSYASLDDLPERDPDAADLKRLLNRQVAVFARELTFDLPKKLKLDSLWVNILKPGGAHSGHIHPHSAISGTLYLEVPPGAGGIRFEDPRLPLMMAAPLRRDDAPDELRPFITIAPRPGMILLWESWLRHEVEANGANAERISISFNYG